MFNFLMFFEALIPRSVTQFIYPLHRDDPDRGLIFLIQILKGS